MCISCCKIFKTIILVVDQRSRIRTLFFTSGRLGKFIFYAAVIYCIASAVYCCVVMVMALVQGDGVWGGGLPPPQIIVINLSPPNTPFLLPVPIIPVYYAVIITTGTCNTDMFFSQFCVACYRLKSCFHLKSMSECYRPSKG